MTLPNMESSEMPQELESSEVQETVESAEVQEAAAQLEQATFEPEAVVELDKSHLDAEVVEAAFTETMQVKEVERPDPSGDGTVGIIDTNDGPRSVTDEAPAIPVILPGQGKESGAERGVTAEDDWEAPNANKLDKVSLSPDDVKIDTVPLPEKPESLSSQSVKDDQVAIGTWPTPDKQLDDIAIIDSNDGPHLGDERVMIDTVPLPEDDLDGVAIIDTNDGPRVAGDDRVKIDTVPLPEEPAMKAVSLDGKGADMDTAAGLDDGTVDQFFDPDRVSEGGRRDGMPDDGMWGAGPGEDIGNMTGGDPRDSLETPGGNDAGLPFDMPPADGVTDGQSDAGIYVGEDDMQGEGLFGKGGIPGVKDPLGGRGAGDGMLPGDLGGPATGPNQEDEMAGLKDAAAPGADGRVGWTGSQGWSDSMDSDGNQNIEGRESYSMDDGSTMTVTTTHENGVTTQTVTHTDADGNTTTETSTDGGGDNSNDNDNDDNDNNNNNNNDNADNDPPPPPPPPPDDETTPDPEGGEGGEMPVLVVGDRVISATPGSRPVLNHAESMMQPVDDEGQKRREGPAMKVSASELRDAQLDPYIQNSGEETSGYSGPMGNLDADGNLIDPPGGMSGGGDGVMMSGDQNANNDELNASDGQNLEAADGKL